MLIKITEKCSVGCTHCMNNAMPNGKHMTLDVFKDSLNFLKENKLYFPQIVITGGEPTEHPEFVEFMEYLADFIKKNNILAFVTVTTNGFWILNNQEKSKEIVSLFDNRGFEFQVSTDKRYYPIKLDTTKRIFRERGFTLCDNCVEALYPQGRALELENATYNAIASKCFNVRAISKQIPNCKLNNIVTLLASRGKFCTPHIKIDGGVGLGESDLCPKCCSIYDSMDVIMDKIKAFKCDGCKHLNDKLPIEHQKFL